MQHIYITTFIQSTTLYEFPNPINALCIFRDRPENLLPGEKITAEKRVFFYVVAANFPVDVQ